jgi:hypothetical protein
MIWSEFRTVSAQGDILAQSDRTTEPLLFVMAHAILALAESALQDVRYVTFASDRLLGLSPPPHP